jgi:hypothetical protein
MGRLVGAALLALLLTQWTALTHAIAHAPLSAGHVVAVAGDEHWDHEAGSSSCALIDHLLLGGSAGSDPPAMPRVQPDAAPWATPSLPIACAATLRAYEARGPPWA